MLGWARRRFDAKNPNRRESGQTYEFNANARSRNEEPGAGGLVRIGLRVVRCRYVAVDLTPEDLASVCAQPCIVHER